MPEENKIFKYLTLFLIIAAFIILLREVILKPIIPSKSIPEAILKIKVNYEILEKPEVKEFLPYEQISLPEKVGRENPFRPY
ncbi:hypothetical protein COS93_00130 [bacterium (Candidatus Gribaldobacteria) CG07_land_8_20_14_0_80_33_18]|uniref:Uncharacterized protein n=1 Tax=bacterium (Candidatus Gribaldobacteria) CG07_land_8_20_14_0_80_33_18 TaxID=2014272 RepID=A0A2M6Z4K0_9BACT|nr:MAG: hypothetical protein COU04_02065 [bacterium (Candidatus Gribaldobacteria) CG10_big_fil_rev_8_21_14_0_10_33_41]PIU47265.1 MAG: hypothetical protein COS93_00130 [bacterium (Candidatus Gribaldobacteria) CG07_land_8_20_14_0_80_33_18]PJA00974.1 MAG: hypothetical protein COX75_01130 [bacterium (Candidatus Gribaldobacteria) CG_4_10_14_0_2_um_filter_33_15]PJB08729.1 MAG: hypothetical protein CO122_01020 [bacterium (Candidatus Gribaldobacteria) CG_4_9_14_3_um_filter_33_9]